MNGDIGMKENAKIVLLALLTPKSIIFGLAGCNFILIWIKARSWETSGLICYLCPWYDPWSYTNAPTLLLIAACCLSLGMRWSYLAAIGLSGFTLSEGIFLNMNLYYDGILFTDGVGIWLANPSLYIQYVLSSIIFGYAGICFGRSIFRQHMLST